MKNYTLTLPENEMKIVHKLVQDYLIQNETTGAYGADLLTAEVNMTHQLFDEQGMAPYGLCSDYVMELHLNGGKSYSAAITDEEWAAFVKEAGEKYADNMDGFEPSMMVMEELWVPEYINGLDKVVVRKVK